VTADDSSSRAEETQASEDKFIAWSGAETFLVTNVIGGSSIKVCLTGTDVTTANRASKETDIRNALRDDERRIHHAGMGAEREGDEHAHVAEQAIGLEERRRPRDNPDLHVHDDEGTRHARGVARPPAPRAPRRPPIRATVPGSPLSTSHPKDPLHGVTLETIVERLVLHHGWAALGEAIPIRCFQLDPSVKSSLTFLRRTPWARAKVEAMYLATIATVAKGR
jgi:hypothetical protein